MTKKAILATVALALLGAALPAAAQAASFHSELSGTTFLHGEQKAANAFKPGNVKCLSLTFGGEASGSAFEAIAIGLVGTQCSAFGRKAELQSGGCQLRLTALTPTSPSRWDSTVRIVCPAGAAITVSVPSASCSLSIGEQLTGGAAAVENEGAGASRRLLVSWELTAIAYQVNGPGTECGTPGEHANGEYTGSAVIKGFATAGLTGQVGIWVE